MIIPGRSPASCNIEMETENLSRGIPWFRISTLANILHSEDMSRHCRLQAPSELQTLPDQKHHHSHQRPLACHRRSSPPLRTAAFRAEPKSSSARPGPCASNVQVGSCSPLVTLGVVGLTATSKR